jgi:hypothetical protein
MFGTYVTRPEYEQYFLKAEDLRAMYLLAGLVQKVGPLRLDVVLADSHLFSGDWRKHTILKLGIGFQL